MSQHFMILPSLACQAHCSYCFGPNRGPIMPPDVFDAAVSWIAASILPGESVEITFHGGEPLLAGKEWYRRNLPILRSRLEGHLKLSFQSNLWLLDDETCALFSEYGVSIGTSLDGPEKINDAQRGKGYYRRTMAGIETARRNGLKPGVICTFTRLSAPYYREVFEFFARHGLSFSIHEVVCTLGSKNDNDLMLLPDKAAGLMVDLFDYYLENISRTQISTFDAMVRGLSAQSSAICTFGDCLGKYLTFAPGGEIFSCNRFAHHPEWQLGSVFDRPDIETLTRSDTWRRLRQRELTVRQDCKDCTHFEYCKGGCPYNAVTGGTDRRDPQCTAYRQLFDHITKRALAEVFSEENLEAVIQHGPGKNGLIHKGRLIQVMKGSAHPQEVACKARETVAAVALACSSSPEEAVEKLERAGIATHLQAALGSLRSLRTRFNQQPQQGLVNAYMHVTYACNLSCSHCYAQAEPGKFLAMSAAEMERLAREAAAARFRKIIITGGEPMVHPKRDELLEILTRLRKEIKPVQIALRTNLAYPMTSDLMTRLALATDQIIVSVDGDETSHDYRRGAGNYAYMLENLQLLMTSEVSKTTDTFLAATLTASQIAGQEGDAVRALGNRLGVKVRFKSVLPLGRGRKLNLTPACYNSPDDSREALAASHGPTATCGLGMNLYISPDGKCFPCYALMGNAHTLGNALVDGLPEVLKQNDRYRQATVDTNELCHTCSVRYLCGGFCRAWSTDGNPDSAPVSCKGLQMRAQELLLGALETLGITHDRWLKAGLPLLGVMEFT